jgi:hypothetical protein
MFVKRTALFLLSLMFLIALSGCSGSDKDRPTASPGSMPFQPSEAAGAEGASGDQAARPPATLHPEANGGSTLRASTPYAGTAPVSQNLNPSPFLTAAEAHGTTTQAVPTAGLTARADGTMYGPNDQPAAGTGPGIVGGGSSTANPPPSARTGGKPVDTKIPAPKR